MTRAWMTHVFEADARAMLQGRYGVLEDASLVAVAVDEEGLVGACVVTVDGPRLLLAFALVALRWLNRGVGAALMGTSADVLRVRGYQEWTLVVTEGSPARRRYGRRGFQADFSLRCGTARSATR